MEDFLRTEALASPSFGYVLPTLACIFSSWKSGVKTYEGYQIIRTNLTTKLSFDVMERIFESSNFDFLTPPNTIRSTDILVCPEQIDTMKRLSEFFQIPYEVTVDDLQERISLERSLNDQIERRENRGGEMTWTSYHRLDTIFSWMDSLSEQYPSLISQLTIGSSSENRPMRVMKISSGKNATGGDKPAVWIDGGIHAREWVSPAVVTYMANELIQGAVSGNENFRYVDTYDFYFLPLHNPDGYAYSHTQDRMWRKTRSGSRTGFIGGVLGCQGADPNRNFEYQWGGKGTSSNPCSQTYKGTKPASEPEVKAVQDFVFANREQLKLFLTFHAYSQMLFTPWGYDSVPLEDMEDMMYVGNRSAAALEAVHGTKFQVGSSSELLYSAAGGSEDYAKAIAGVKFSYCYELRDTGKHGFTLPPDQIIPSGRETFASLTSMLDDIKIFYNM